LHHQICTPNKLDLTFQAPNHCAKFHENQIKIAAVAATLTDRREWFYNLSHAILWPMATGQKI